MFFMASFNIDMFRRFVLSENFRRSYKLPEQLYTNLTQDDLLLMKFGFQFLRQTLFGERSIQEVDDAWEQRVRERSKIWETRASVIQTQRQLDEPAI
jgi:hypothetical protein